MTNLHNISHSNLNHLVSGLSETDSDHIFKQLTENSFELDHFFNDISANATIKVNMTYQPDIIRLSNLDTISLKQTFWVYFSNLSWKMGS